MKSLCLIAVRIVWEWGVGSGVWDEERGSDRFSYLPLATLRLDDASILDQLDQVRGDLNLRSPVKPWIEIGIDALPHLTRGARASCEDVEDLFLALQTVSKILRNQGGGVISRRAVRRKDPFRIVRQQKLERCDVVAHRAVRRKDRGRPFAENRIAGEEIARRREKANVFCRVTGRGNHFECLILDRNRFAAADALIDERIVEHAARRDDSRAGHSLQRHCCRRVIAMTMCDQNRGQLRHRTPNRLDVRIDRRTRIDHGRLAEEVCSRSTQRERARIRSGDVADDHGRMIFFLPSSTTSTGRVVGTSTPRREASNSSAEVNPASASRFFSVGKTICSFSIASAGEIQITSTASTFSAEGIALWSTAARKK